MPLFGMRERKSRWGSDLIQRREKWSYGKGREGKTIRYDPFYRNLLKVHLSGLSLWDSILCFTFSFLLKVLSVVFLCKTSTQSTSNFSDSQNLILSSPFFQIPIGGCASQVYFILHYSSTILVLLKICVFLFLAFVSIQSLIFAKFYVS